MFYPNGIMIQQTNFWSRTLPSKERFFPYAGLNAFLDTPLLMFPFDSEARALHEEFQDGLKYIKMNSKSWLEFEIFHDVEFLRRYIKKCLELEIPIQLLFIESEFDKPLWNSAIPKTTLIGYEFCSSPFDCQIITDLFFYKPFAKHTSLLNEHGLFDSYEQCVSFAKDYEIAFANGEIGDGDADNYIFKLSRLDYNTIL